MVINYQHAKIKAKQWRLLDSIKFTKKIFKGKIKNNLSDLMLQSFGVGYIHKLIGKIDNDKIVLNFSSTLKMADDKFSECTFIFSRDPENFKATETKTITTDTTTSSKNKNENKSNVFEEKLKKLKSYYNENLISKEEYDQKRKEILDTM